MSTIGVKVFIFSLLISFDYHSENFASPKVFFEVRHDGKCVGKEQIRHFTFVDSLCPLILFFLKFLLFFIYFLAVLGLHCCTWAFSSCAVQASHCSGFSCCGSWALGTQASVVVALRLSSCGSQALEHRLSSCGARA